MLKFVNLQFRLQALFFAARFLEQEHEKRDPQKCFAVQHYAVSGRDALSLVATELTGKGRRRVL